jgi:hypothetical protein
MNTIHRIAALVAAVMMMCAPALAAVPASKANDALYILLNPTKGDASWAATTLRTFIAEHPDAVTPAPAPTPAPTPAPNPPAQPAGISIANSAALQAAVAKAAGGEVFNLAAGKYALSVSGKKNLTFNGAAAGVTFGEWTKVANSTNITFSNVDFVQSSTGDANSVLLSPSSVDGLILKNVNFIGQPGGYGFAVFAKDGTTKNVRAEGGSAKRLEYGFRFNQAQGLYITGFAFSELTADGVQLGGNSRDVTVTKSTYRNWKPARGSHPDALQMVCAAYNITFSYNDVDASVQGPNQFANAAACPNVGTTNFIVEYNSFRLGTYANAVYAGYSTGRIAYNKLFKATYSPMIRVVGGSMAVTGNTLDGKPYP